MKNGTMKVRMMTEDPESDSEYGFNDLYIDKELISGFFVPDLSEEDNLVNIVYPGLDIITIKADKDIKDYLIDRFVEN